MALTKSFVSTGRLGVFGDCRFTVSGHLTIRNGLFEVSPLTGYARSGFPTAPYKSSVVTVRGNFNVPSPAILRFHIFNKNKTVTVNVKGAAVLAGSLQAGVEDLSKIDADDRLTVLTADEISAQFSNGANGGRGDVYGRFDDLGNPIGDPAGTFRVIYNDGALLLSDFARK